MTETLASGLTLRYVESCAPRGVDQITIEALGDFPASEGSFASLDADQGKQRLTTLPLDTQLYRVRVTTASFRGTGLASAANDGTAFDAIVLPLSRVCLALSEGLPAREGQSAALSAGGDLLITGGLSGAGLAQSEGARIDLERQALDGAPLRTFVPRAFALALEVGEETWILGGTQSNVSQTPAFDSFERYDAVSGRFASLGRLARARLQAGGVVLADGSVLLAGGRDAVMGRALDSLERIRAPYLAGELLDATLPEGAVAPTLHLRDDGVVVIAQASDSTATLSLYDPANDALEVLPFALDELSPSLVVTLPGARIAVVETRNGETTGALWVLDDAARAATLTGSLTSFAGLTDGLALALRDGRILLTGTHDSAPTARIIDPGTLRVQAHALTSLPRTLLLRADGAVLVHARESVSLFRGDDRSPFDSPGGTLLADDDGVLALDARPRWERRGLALRALHDGARLDLAGLTYADVRVTIESSGAAELLLRRAFGEERTIEVGDTRTGPTLCTIPHAAGTRVSVTRRGRDVVIESEGREQRCTLDGLEGRIALGVRVRDADTELRYLAVERR